MPAETAMNENFVYALEDEIGGLDEARDLIKKTGPELPAIQRATVVFFHKRLNEMLKHGEHIESTDEGMPGFVNIEIEHTHWLPRCGDCEKTQFEYQVPFAVLFGDADLMAWRDDVDRERKEAREREEAVREAKRRVDEAARTEQRERARLAELLAKYGMPD